MLKRELLYDSLNSISNNEFENIMNTKTPVEKALNIQIQKNVYEYLDKTDENIFKIKDKNGDEKEVFVKYITLVDFLKYLKEKYKNENLDTLPTDDNETPENNFQKYICDKNNYLIDSLFITSAVS